MGFRKRRRRPNLRSVVIFDGLWCAERGSTALRPSSIQGTPVTRPVPADLAPPLPPQPPRRRPPKPKT